MRDFAKTVDTAVALLKEHFAKHDQPVSFFLTAMDETTEWWEAHIVGDDPYAVGAVAATFLQHAEPQLRERRRKAKH